MTRLLLAVAALVAIVASRMRRRRERAEPRGRDREDRGRRIVAGSRSAGIEKDGRQNDRDPSVSGERRLRTRSPRDSAATTVVTVRSRSIAGRRARPYIRGAIFGHRRRQARSGRSSRTTKPLRAAALAATAPDARSGPQARRPDASARMTSAASTPFAIGSRSTASRLSSSTATGDRARRGLGRGGRARPAGSRWTTVSSGRSSSTTSASRSTIEPPPAEQVEDLGDAIGIRTCAVPTTGRPIQPRRMAVEAIRGTASRFRPRRIARRACGIRNHGVGSP